MPALGEENLGKSEFTTEQIWLALKHPQNGAIKQPLGQTPVLFIRGK
jgi:hypothetical protein